MWKCGTRRFRDTVERSANHYDKCSSAGINPPWCDFFNHADKKNKQHNPPSCWFIAQKCWNSFTKENDTKHKRWNFEHLNRTWIGAIAWSSALVFGWYTSHLIHLKCKSSHKKFYIPKVYNLFDALAITGNSQKSSLKLDLSSKIENFIGSSQVHVVSNDHSSGSAEASSSGVWTTGSGSGPSDSDLGDVLNSIENRLGLAAIESGQYHNGLNLLRSAANRNHPPAIYNLGLCYEMGLGVAVDEKMAMEFYRTAASLQHPGALYNLGIYYGQGRAGLTRDQTTAMRLLKLAAVQGHVDAIAAIKGLEPETSGSLILNDKVSENNSFNDEPSTSKQHTAPTHSALFTSLQNFNYEPVVF